MAAQLRTGTGLERAFQLVPERSRNANSKAAAAAAPPPPTTVSNDTSTPADSDEDDSGRRSPTPQEPFGDIFHFEPDEPVTTSRSGDAGKFKQQAAPPTVPGSGGSSSNSSSGGGGGRRRGMRGGSPLGQGENAGQALSKVRSVSDQRLFNELYVTMVRVRWPLLVDEAASDKMMQDIATVVGGMVLLPPDESPLPTKGRLYEPLKSCKSQLVSRGDRAFDALYLTRSVVALVTRLALPSSSKKEPGQKEAEQKEAGQEGPPQNAEAPAKQPPSERYTVAFRLASDVRIDDGDAGVTLGALLRAHYGESLETIDIVRDEDGFAPSPEAVKRSGKEARVSTIVAESGERIDIRSTTRRPETVDGVSFLERCHENLNVHVGTELCGSAITPGTRSKLESRNCFLAKSPGDLNELVQCAYEVARVLSASPFLLLAWVYHTEKHLWDETRGGLRIDGGVRHGCAPS